MTARTYSQVNGTLRVEDRSVVNGITRVVDRSVVGAPVDFYVAVAEKCAVKASAWIRGAPHLHQRLTSAFHARNRAAFDALVDQLMKENPCQ